MFALIDTKNATHIAIHVPHEGADKTLPALLGMLENNAVFVKKNWHTFETCTSETTITLGSKIVMEGQEAELAIVVPSSDHVLDASFLPVTPDVLISNKNAIDKKDSEIARLRTELAHVKQQCADLQNALDEDTAP